MFRWYFDLLNRRVSWANWWFGPIKIAMLGLGLVLGALFAGFWGPHLWLIGAVTAAAIAWSLALWTAAMRRPTA